MITVAGEALLDILLDGEGNVAARPGGAALNVARTIARLGGECSFLGRISQDSFGSSIASALLEDGVRIASARPAPEPTTLAVAEVDDDGIADYGFYLAGTSAAQLLPGDIPVGLARATRALVLGGLGLLMEPIASTLAGMLGELPRESLVVLDPNCRPHAAGDTAAHRRLIADVCARADVVKVSVDDLALLAPGAEPARAARDLIAGSAVALLSDGAAPVRVIWHEHEEHVQVPSVPVRDTVGAGDALVGAFTLWWAGRSLAAGDLQDTGLVCRAVVAAAEIAALTCTSPGAQPPAIPRWLDAPGAARELIDSAPRARG